MMFKVNIMSDGLQIFFVVRGVVLTFFRSSMKSKNADSLITRVFFC